MDKIKAYHDVTKCPYGITENFLDGLHYVERFSFFYNLIKEIDIEIDILPSFPYTDYRVTDEEIMKVFYIQIKNTSKTVEELISYLNERVTDGTFNYSCSFNADKEAIQVTLL